MNNIKKSRSRLSLVVIATIAMVSSVQAVPTKFTNVGSIANTRHNMTQSTTTPLVSGTMDKYRNNYGEVCVYCHTPHGANRQIAAPLWNRTIRATTYQTYDQLGTTSLMGSVSQPGAASLTCLSCHDGQTAIDSIINMPTTQVLTNPVSGTRHGNGLISQETTQNVQFLDSWTNPAGTTAEAQRHMGLNSTNLSGSPYTLGNGTGSDNIGCLSCHSEPTITSGGSTDFTMFLIGTDLRNDHPVGIDFPIALANTPGSDWNKPANTQGSSLYFEEIPNGRMDKYEIRLYEGKVECASCHDPHGVPSVVGDRNSEFNKTFLRKQNNDTSKVCFTCHNK